MKCDMTAEMRPVAIHIGLSLLSAVMLFLAVPTFGVWPLMWVALMPQLWVALEAPTAKRSFLYGWLTGSVAHAVAFYWMTGLLEKFGHMPAWEALPIVGLLVVYQGLAFGLFSWGVRRLHARRALPLAVLAPLVMVAIELVMPQMFPYYLAISVAFVPSLIQIADITGPVGVTALLVAASGALLDAYRARDRGWKVAGRNVAIVAALTLLDVGYGAVRIHQADTRRAAAPKVKTGVVQANIGILEKWEPSEFARLLATHQRESATLARAGAELMVWPESSYPYALPRAPQAFARDFPIDDERRVRRGFDTPILFGAVTVNPLKGGQRRDRYPYNTALMMNGAGDITGTYDKVFLMLFGEYIPFYDAIPWFTDLFPEASNFNRGSEPAWFPLTVGGRSYRLGPLICYEDILPSFARRVAKLDPNAFVNITNDAWFGRTAEPYQHLALAVFRSVEHRLEMIRAVNTGVSAHIDAAGRVVAETESVDPAASPPPTSKTLLVDLAMLPGGGLYRHIGDLFGFLCLTGLAALTLWRQPQSSAANSGGRKKSRRAPV
jgi:apolipoprotein N-acyltransferase